MIELSDLVYREKRRGPRTERWRTPIVRVGAADTDHLHITCRSNLPGRSVQSVERTVLRGWRVWDAQH
jgi:hypothetical protein